MAQKKRKKRGILMFVDTNIFLDFYRIQKSDVSLNYLKKLDTLKEKLILTEQVEMEYKKNRQGVILEMAKEMTFSDSSGLPEIFSDKLFAKKEKAIKKDSKQQKKKFQDQIKKILDHPTKNDPVFISLEKIFSSKSTYNLGRKHEGRSEIRKLAIKRFLLGYPPRKKEDNSIGDAINWEWVIRCAKLSKCDIIVVTRDGDFGKTDNKKSYLNDWLKTEFKERVGVRRKIHLTQSLSEAFKLMDIKVTKQMVEEEREIIDSSLNSYHLKKIRELHDQLNNEINLREGSKIQKQEKYILDIFNNFHKLF